MTKRDMCGWFRRKVVIFENMANSVTKGEAHEEGGSSGSHLLYVLCICTAL